MLLLSSLLSFTLETLDANGLQVRPRIPDCQQSCSEHWTFCNCGKDSSVLTRAWTGQCWTLRSFGCLGPSTIGGMVLYRCRQCMVSCAHKATSKVMPLDQDAPYHQRGHSLALYARLCTLNQILCPRCRGTRSDQCLHRLCRGCPEPSMPSTARLCTLCFPLLSAVGRDRTASCFRSSVLLSQIRETLTTWRRPPRQLVRLACGAL